MAAARRIPLRVVFYREDDYWIAHGLEFDLVGHGSTKQESLGLVLEHIRAQVADSFASGNLENLFFPAPGRSSTDSPPARRTTAPWATWSLNPSNSSSKAFRPGNTCAPPRPIRPSRRREGGSPLPLATHRPGVSVSEDRQALVPCSHGRPSIATEETAKDRPTVWGRGRRLRWQGVAHEVLDRRAAFAGLQRTRLLFGCRATRDYAGNGFCSAVSIPFRA